MSSSRRFVSLFVCLAMASACEMASGAPDQDEVFHAKNPTSDNTKAASALSAQVRPVAPATSLDARGFRAVVGVTTPRCDLTSVIWTEDDAKLLLAMVLRSMCSMVSGCTSWRWDALELGPQGSVMLSASSSARLAAEAKARRAAGDEREALLVEEWETNAASDLESVSSIGLSSAAVQQVLVGVTDEAYVRELHAKVRNRSAAALAAACPGRSIGLPGLATHTKAVRLGAVESATGGDALDTALDMSCENVLPGKTYCANYDPQHEWATGNSPHHMNVAFAVSARRCEPCQDGYGVGTLRLIKNVKNQAMTMCDTGASCNPSADPTVPACSCMR